MYIPHLVYCEKCYDSYMNGIILLDTDSFCLGIPPVDKNATLSSKTAILSDMFTNLGNEFIFTVPSKTFSFRFLTIAVLADGRWLPSVV